MFRVMHGISSLQGSLQDRATTHNPPILSTRISNSHLHNSNFPLRLEIVTNSKKQKNESKRNITR